MICLTNTNDQCFLLAVHDRLSGYPPSLPSYMKPYIIILTDAELVHKHKLIVDALNVIAVFLFAICILYWFHTCFTCAIQVSLSFGISSLALMFCQPSCLLIRSLSSFVDTEDAIICTRLFILCIVCSLEADVCSLDVSLRVISYVICNWYRSLNNFFMHHMLQLIAIK